MRIIADRAIPLVKEAFGSTGELKVLPASEITREVVKDADVLLVRTRTKVDRRLLEGSSIQFVASATAGTDHVDFGYLKDAGIAFANAAGCNANAVAEYVFAALAWLSGDLQFDLSKKTIGVIGVGNVGSRVVRKARLLGMKVFPNDPPKARESGDESFVSLVEALSADIVTFHVPLTKTGEDATYHLGNSETLGRLRPESILINTSRGPVVDNRVLESKLREGAILGAVLDVWENEPDLDWDLPNLLNFGTPHVAGYSQEAKLNATRMVFEATSRQFGLVPPASGGFEGLFRGEKGGRIGIPEAIQRPVDGLTFAFRNVYDIREDDAAIRKLASLEPGEASKQFEFLRNNYRFRRECSAFELALNDALKPSRQMFADFGFLV